MTSPNPKDISPSFAEIIVLAEKCGYKQRRPTASSTLFFQEISPAYDMPPALINVYPTTRSIMTYLNHPKQSTNELWRSNAYDTLQELEVFFRNPRTHTGQGYRQAHRAVRGCVKCGEMKKRTEFSQNQWRQGPDENKCKSCVDGNVPQENLLDEFQRLSMDALDAHNKKEQINNKTIGDKNNKNNNLERRQFNCPECPQQGRGTMVFFKKVPVYKPVVKCPQCKKATRGKCARLYPVPRDQEKGYGFYKCHECQDKWGSSRAVAQVGQECFSCREQGRPHVMVRPFRMEVLKTKKKPTGGRRRVPREPIREHEVEEREYTLSDGQRNSTGAGNALVGGGSGADGFTRSYDYQDSESDDNSSRPSQDVKPTNGRIPQGYRHKCAVCATGACKSRRVPRSQVHDVSDGNTVSTSASLVTNSSIDKSDFVDRDEDFSGFDLGGDQDFDDSHDDFDNDDDGEGPWIQV